MEYVGIPWNQRFNLKIYHLMVVLGTSVLFALSSWISIRLPFTPVPISFTCQLILLSSLLLGKRGAYATLAYLGQGAAGLPVFANGGAGIGYLLGPTGGYLIGFLVASFFVATFSEKIKERSCGKLFTLMFLGNLVVYFFGISHLALLIGWRESLFCGFFPFIGPDLIKLMLALKWAKLSDKFL